MKRKEILKNALIYARNISSAIGDMNGVLPNSVFEINRENMPFFAQKVIQDEIQKYHPNTKVRFLLPEQSDSIRLAKQKRIEGGDLSPSNSFLYRRSKKRYSRIRNKKR